MKLANYRIGASALALTLGLAATPAFAQTAAPPADATETSDLDTIVVTASGRDKTQLNSSVAITNVSAELIQTFRPTSESEALRLIPGIQVSGTAGPGGNSNIAVRGLPVATGGSPFVQLQEDGLPTVLFGDIQFGNNDYWTHLDATTASVEAVRGGGATTYASQAPGAVVNFISHTGKTEGGFVAVNKGVSFDETKVDFRYGGPINDTLRFHVGGYYKVGRGPLHAGYNVSNSFQVKANLTKEFDEGKGYIRLLFKVADTQEPNYTGSPALATITNKVVSGIQPFPGFDGRKQSNYSIFNQDFTILNRDGVLERVKMDGITTEAKSIGGQFHYEFSDAIQFDDNMRWTDMSGGFAAPFLNVSRAAGIVGSTFSRPGLADVTVGSIRYASGPNAGTVFNGTYVDNNVNVRTNIRDIGSFANDLALSGKFELGAAKLTVRAGYFYMNQKIAMDWHVNKSLREVSGNNPSQLDLFDSAGNKLTQQGVSGYNNNWGNCCARDYDLSYANSAPYLSLDLSGDQFQVDGSIRFESVKASGAGTQGGPEFVVNSNGVPITAIISNGTRETLNYTRNYASWTIGGGFKPAGNLNIFARASRGGRFNGDRQTFGGKISSSGALCTSAAATSGAGGCGADGVTPSVDFVNQYEIGIKNQGGLAGGRYSVQFSLLKANFKQSTFELSATKCPGGAGGCIIDAKYRSSGAEFTGTYSNGGFSFFANATFTKSQQLVGTAYTRAPNLPDLTYNMVASYDISDMFGLGLGLTGQTSALDSVNGNQYPGGAVFNGNLRVTPIANLELGVQAYNLFNKFDLRGNGGVSDASVTPNVIGGNPALGRTFTASAKYSF